MRPLAQGLLTGRVRKGRDSDPRRTRMFQHMRDERRLDAVEKIIPVAEHTMDHPDAIVRPGTDIGRLDMACTPPATLNPARRRREPASRSAT